MFIEIENKNFYNIVDEQSLQRSVVKYLRDCDLLFSSTLGGTLDTVTRRLDAHLDGYGTGIPDIMIYTPSSCGKYSLLCIELKTPWGNGSISKHQRGWLDRLEKESDAFCIVCNDYTAIIEVVIKYIHGLL